jgi:hypothetical protein
VLREVVIDGLVERLAALTSSLDRLRDVSIPADLPGEQGELAVLLVGLTTQGARRSGIGPRRRSGWLVLVLVAAGPPSAALG